MDISVHWEPDLHAEGQYLKENKFSTHTLKRLELNNERQDRIYGETEILMNSGCVSSLSLLLFQLMITFYVSQTFLSWRLGWGWASAFGISPQFGLNVFLIRYHQSLSHHMPMFLFSRLFRTEYSSTYHATVLIWNKHPGGIVVTVFILSGRFPLLYTQFR